MRGIPGPLLTLALLTAGGAAAQHEITPADIKNGEGLYAANCAGCHGAEGDAIQGVALKSGRFRSASSDRQLVDIIINGLPGTGMPPNPFTEQDAATIVAYLRSVAPGAAAPATEVGRPAAPSSAVTPRAALSDRAEQGRTVVFGKGNCMTCHRIDGVGVRVGPDLSNIGTTRRPEDLHDALVNPSALIAPANRFVRLVTADNQTLTGRLLNHDRFTIQIIDSRERLVSLSKETLRELTFLDGSTMPSYRGTLTPTELEDVVSYLSSLKSGSTP